VPEPIPSPPSEVEPEPLPEPIPIPVDVVVPVGSDDVLSFCTEREIPDGAAGAGSTGPSALQPAATTTRASRNVNRRIWTSRESGNRTLCASKMRSANVHLQHMHGLK
jgi:hypothetical protein